MGVDELKKTLRDYSIKLSQQDKTLSAYKEQELQICEYLLELLEKLEQGILFPSDIRLSLYDGLNGDSIIYTVMMAFLRENPDTIMPRP